MKKFSDNLFRCVLLISFVLYTGSLSLDDLDSEEDPWGELTADSEEDPTVSEENVIEPPKLIIREYYMNRSWQEDWKLVNLPSEELAVSTMNKNNPILHLVCTAPYEIRWNGLDDLNVHKMTSYCSGSFKCSAPTLPSLIVLRSAKKRGERPFVNNGKTLEYSTSDTWVKCPTGNISVAVKLLRKNREKNGTLEILNDYLKFDAYVGFELQTKLKGEYICYAGENDFVRFINPYDKYSNPTPTLKIINEHPYISSNEEWDTVSLPHANSNTLGVVAKNRNYKVMHLDCIAPYKLEWIGLDNLKLKGHEVTVSSKLPELENFTVAYGSFLRVVFKTDGAPAVEELRCEHLSRRIFTKIYFFFPGNKVLINSGETITYNANDENWIKCPTFNPTILVYLYALNTTDNETLFRIEEYLHYDPVIGFQLKTQAKGNYVCKVNDDDWVRFEPFSSSSMGSKPTSGSFKENKSVLKFVLQQKDINFRCQDEDLAFIVQGRVRNEEYRRNVTTTMGSHMWVEINTALDDKIEILINNTSLKTPLVDVFCVKKDNLMIEGNNITTSQDRLTKKWTINPVRLRRTTEFNTAVDSYYSNKTDGTPFQTVDWEGFPFDEAIFMLSDGESTLHTNLTSRFTCKTSRHQEHLMFWMESANGYEKPLFNDSANFIMITIEDRSFFKFKGWTLSIQLPLDAVAIKCKIAAFHPTLYLGGERRFKTKDLLRPAVITSFSPARYLFHEGDTYKHIACHATGEPEPTYIWEKNGQAISNLVGFKQRTGSNEESILEFPEIRKSHAGMYTCKAVNRLGTDSFKFTVTVEDNPKEAQERRTRAITITAVIIVVLFALLMCGFGIYRYYAAKALLRGLTEEEIKDFFEGRPELAKQVESQPFAGDFDVLPYNTSFEVDFNDAVLDYNSILGKGEFAIVVKGSIKSKGVEVAVKIAKGTADVTLFKSLLSEVKILSYIGSHANVAGLVGVNTADIQKKNIYIYMDLCELGSLEKYLRSCKSKFVDLIDDQREINLSNLSTHHSEGFISTLDLIRWSAEIAAGMEYLSYKSIVHADLAARNVLLTREKTVRVSDFGLSKKLYECNLYVKKTKCPLPWRWMALESLQTLTFSPESDVWSYGVTLWEIFTLGDVPFPNEEWNKAFVDMLICGIRMGKPKYGTTKIYSKIGECWDEKPFKRPQFTTLRNYFHQLLETTLGSSDAPVYCQI